MDNIQSKLSNVSLYDVKAYVRKAQNAVLNFSDMEAKVREATNNEPWGTPTSVMQEIADGTQSYQQFHEIMPFVYRRFTEKSATQWRQIYKALNLLDYLVKNGSERVVDYARSHTAVIEMLKHFHYESHTGEDRGAGIRRRAEELLSLLGNVEKIRAERKKARALNQKTGVSSRTSASGFGTGSGSASGSLGSSRGSRSAGFYGDAARSGSRSGNYDSGMTSGAWGATAGDGVYGGGGADYDNYHSSTSVNNLHRDNDEWEEYDADVPTKTKAVSEPAPADDDDFAEFQSAPASTAPKPTTTDSILDLFSSPAPMNTTTTTPAAPSLSEPSLVGISSSTTFTAAPTTTTTTTSTTTSTTTPTTKPKDDIFGSLWETSKSSTTMTPKQTSMSSFGITPAPAPAPKTTTASNNGSSGQVDDLLLL